MLKWLLVLAACVALVATANHGRHWRLPDRYNPWATLEIDAAPNVLTRYKLARLEREPALCLAVLQTSGFRFEPVPDRETGPGCGFENAVQISHTDLQPNAAFTLNCPAAVALALWEHHSVLPTAQRLLGSPARRLMHFGSYACRNVYGRESGQRSEHALANAIDVAGFELQNGQKISVARHWRGDDARAAFLHRIHDDACQFFGGVFGPDYNAAHADHLHLDRGPYRLCR
ncbi:MAG: extensin family protein [Pseudomonadota bacterium]|nr:extensin family protein [Pseudomonadota bacterium]